MSQLKRQFGAPIYHQLFTVLHSEITSGKYASGDVLPGEETLRDLYGVSRNTVRRALLALEQEGLIERRQGSGTRVTPQSASAVTLLSTYLNEIGRYDTTSAVRIHSYEFVRPPASIHEALAIAPDERVLRVVRVRIQGEQPLWHLTNYIPEPLATLLDRNILEKHTLFEALKQAGSPCNRADELVGATLADPAVAALLAINVGAPLLESYRLMVDAEGKPISVQITLIPPARRRLRIRVYADESAVLPLAGEPGLLMPRHENS